MSVRKLIFGRPGSGKTTLLVKEVVEALDDGILVFSNVKINWFGKLFVKDKFTNFLNFLISLFLRLIFFRRKAKMKKFRKRIGEIDEISESIIWYRTPSGQEIPNRDLTDLYYEQYNLLKSLKKLEQYDMVIKDGLIDSYYYPKHNLYFFEDIEEAISRLLDKAQENPNEHFLFAWDEGFIDLDHSAKVPRYITNFLNQTRKLQVDVSIASQRPVAVYPSFRALCDYMVRCEQKMFGRIEGRQYWVDTRADALPDLSLRYDKDGKEIDESERYDKFRGSKIWPFFDTRQSIALKRLFNK